MQLEHMHHTNRKHNMLSIVNSTTFTAEDASESVGVSEVEAEHCRQVVKYTFVSERLPLNLN